MKDSGMKGDSIWVCRGQPVNVCPGWAFLMCRFILSFLENNLLGWHIPHSKSFATRASRHHPWQCPPLQRHLIPSLPSMAIKPMMRPPSYAAYVSRSLMPKGERRCCVTMLLSTESMTAMPIAVASLAVQQQARTPKITRNI